MATRKTRAQREAADQAEVKATFVKVLAPTHPGSPERVQFLVVLERYVDIALREKKKTGEVTASIRVDRADYANVGGLRCFTYGEGRHCRDGAKTGETVRDAHGKPVKLPNGKVKVREGTEDEKVRWAVEHATKRVEVLKGKRFLAEKAESVPPLIRYLREYLNTWISDNLTDANGKRFTGKTMPDGISKGTTLESVKQAAMDVACPPAAFDAILAQAQVSADAKAALAGIKVKVSHTAKRKTVRRKKVSRKR